MADPNTQQPNSDDSSSNAVDWDSLSGALGTKNGAEAQKRAFDIAKFVAEVENDADSQLILQTGNKKVELKLNR
ncbi:MAG TPA: hypothetical protein VKB38_12015 [Terracidiphilus sp.]|nr:hypothetical protein [Terracidiphilus sp.]